MSLVPRRQAEAYRQAVLATSEARRDGRYRLFASVNLEGPEAQALYAVLRARRPWLDATLAVFERRTDRPPAGTASDVVPVMADGFAKMQQVTRRAALEGARVVMGGHTSVPFAGRGEAPWRELELLVASGFTPLEAITAATATAAAFLYRSDELGRLRPGFLARPRGRRRQPGRGHLGHPIGRTGHGQWPMGGRRTLPAVLTGGLHL